jgi:hypothetical protein
VIGARSRELRPEGEMVLQDVLPGDNRWVCLSLAAADDRDGSLVAFEELVGGPQ